MQWQFKGKQVNPEMNYYRPHETGSNRSMGFLLIVLLVGAAVGLGVSLTIFLAGQRIVTVTTAQTGSGLIEYAFSPGRQYANIVIKWIQKANSSIHVLIYSFTLDNVRDALIQAKNRGVDVKIVMEEENSNEAGSEYMVLKNAGINIRLDSNRALMHDKVAIIDGHIILTGSFNWTTSANNENNENLVVLDNQPWAAAFESQFQTIYNAAT